MVRSFTTYSLGTIIVGASRGMIGIGATALGTVILSRRATGWTVLRIPASESARPPRWVAVAAKLVRRHTPRARHWVLLGADRDCDGTTYHANRVQAWTLAGAESRADQYTYDVVTARAFKRSTAYRGLDDWERGYFERENYCSLGADWAPWVEDDTIGTPLDSTYDSYPYVTGGLDDPYTTA